MKTQVGLVVYPGLAALAFAAFRPQSPSASPGEHGSRSPGSVTARPEHRVTARMLGMAGEASGMWARPFVAPAGDGGAYSLSELTNSRPLVLLFIKEGCPCSESAQPFFNRLHEAYGDRANFAGVIDGDVEAARAWGMLNRVPFPILADPGLEIVRGFAVRNSAYAVLVGNGGRVEKMWPGYSAAVIEELSGEIARLAHSDRRLIAAADAPAEMYSGCPYPDAPVAGDL